MSACGRRGGVRSRRGRASEREGCRRPGPMRDGAGEGVTR
ncbi:hypothetical protein BURPS305_0392 [Burkholderia pseudomallei 305]|nr:hypothetical protein BURPS305_0392 [Burkholderia pseudomallei 305]